MRVVISRTKRQSASVGRLSGPTPLVPPLSQGFAGEQVGIPMGKATLVSDTPYLDRVR